MAAINPIPMSDAFKGQEFAFTVNVVVYRDWRFKIGFFLIRLGMWIMGSMVKTYIEDKN